jgi:hypothetical protein
MGSINKSGDLAFIDTSDSSFSTPTRHIPPVPPMEDQVQIATVPSVAQVEQLQSANSSSLEAVLGDAIIKLRAAAFQSTDPLEVQYLSTIADRFQRMEEAEEGILPPSLVQDPSSSGAP